MTSAISSSNKQAQILTFPYTGLDALICDGAGRAVAGVFKSAPVRQGRDWFVRMEAHSWQPQENGGPLYIIENKAFRSSPEGSVGAPVALSDVREFAQYEPRAEIANLTGPLFAYFKPPQANDVEPDSSMGVSVYAGPTAELIRQADEQWERLRWAFAVAEPKILSDGRLTQRQLSDRVFISGDFTSDGNLFEIFDPEVKDSAYYRGLQYILQRIEYNVGLAFGTISDPQSVEKTATEILAAKHRQFVTEAAIQRAFQAALDGLLYAMDVWCDLARLAPAGTYQVQYSWGDGILDDPETRRQDMALDMQQVAAGLMNDWEFRVKWYGEDEQTAKASLPGMQSMADEGQNEVE